MARRVHFETSELNGPFTDGSPSFDPDKSLDAKDSDGCFQKAWPLLDQNYFRQAVITAFNLPQDDDYTYHAIASVTLGQVQSAVNAGAANGLHNWYFAATGTVLLNPPRADIDAYVAVFEPGAAPSSALASFASNAKKDSIRKDIGKYLLEKRHVHPLFPNPKKRKKLAPVPENPAFGFWMWSCRALEWAGPTKNTANVKTAHHVLPVMMHHFGCVTPSEEAFTMLKHVASGDGAQREIVEIGSGNGYWAMMLRRRGLIVTAIDNQQSVYRTMWIGDTVREDGVRWLKKNGGAKGKALLLVYPITAGSWTAEVLRAYAGDYICVAGTQNENRYTAFSDETVESWMTREKRSFQKMVQIPLPSFAGKDEALYLYQRTKS